MATIKILTRLCLSLFFLFANTSLNAGIPMIASFERIALMSKKHFFIEANREEGSVVYHSQNVHNLNMLAELLASKNSPPDLVSAIKLALPNATIAATEPDIIRVTDQSLTTKKLKVFDSPVKINGYSGRVGDLLSSISLEKRTLMLDQVISYPGSGYKAVEKRNFQVKNFIFTGTLRGMLTALATQIGPSGSYYASLDDSYLIVRFFPFEDK